MRARQKPKRQASALLDDFRADMPLHNFIFLPSREPWPASSVNSRLSPMPVLDANGKPVLNETASRNLFRQAHGSIKTNRSSSYMQQGCRC